MDLKNNGDGFNAFNDAQRVTATSSFAAAVSELRKDIPLIKHLTDREAHAVMLLGSRGAFSRNDVELEPMTATRFVETLQVQFGVSDTAAENDYRALKEADIITTAELKTDKRVRVIVLSDKGEELYTILAARIANLILAAAELLQTQGAVPVDPVELAKPYLRNYAARIRNPKG